MKRIVFLLLLLSVVSASAQFMNQRRGRGIRQSPMPNQNQPQEFVFNPEKAIGIVIYDVERAAKKIGLKNKKKDEYKQFSTLLTKFNKDMRDLARINSFTFSQEKQNVESSHKLSMESRDFSLLEKAYKQASEKFKPIVDQVKEKEKKLDTSFKTFLSKKQMTKWGKYKQKQKTKRP